MKKKMLGSQQGREHDVKDIDEDAEERKETFADGRESRSRLSFLLMLCTCDL